MGLLRACEINDEHAVACLIDGMENSTLQSAARAGKFKNPEDFYTSYLSSLIEEPDRYQSTNKGTISKTKVFIQRDKHHVYQKERKCFNYGDKSHLANKCTKPRLECSKCHRLGHETTKCRLNFSTNKALACNVEGSSQKCYYIDCIINGQKWSGFIDTGCSIVTIKECVAERLQLKMTTCQIMINGYGGGSVHPLGQAMITLEVDIVKVDVIAYIVNDSHQEVDVMIGQSFLNQENITLVMRNNKLRLLSSELVQLPDIDVSPSKVAIMVAKEITLPPNHITHVKVTNKQDYDGDLYLQRVDVMKPGQEYCIPNCVMSTHESTIPILNCSQSEITFKVGQLLARGHPCQEDDANLEI